MLVYIISSIFFLLLAVFFWKQKNIIEKKLSYDFKYKLKKRSTLYNTLSFLSAFITVVIYIILLMKL